LSTKYIKKFIWVILLMLFIAAAMVAILWYFAPEPAEHEYSGLFIMHFDTICYVNNTNHLTKYPWVS